MSTKKQLSLSLAVQLEDLHRQKGKKLPDRRHGVWPLDVDVARKGRGHLVEGHDDFDVVLRIVSEHIRDAVGHQSLCRADHRRYCLAPNLMSTDAAREKENASLEAAPRFASFLGSLIFLFCGPSRD